MPDRLTGGTATIPPVDSEEAGEHWHSCTSGVIDPGCRWCNPGPTDDTSPDPQPADLDTLTEWVEAALDSSAIRVTVQEADGSASPLRRLVRCLRSAGLLVSCDGTPDSTEEEQRG